LIHTLDISHYEYNDAFKCIDSEIIDYICDSLNNNVNQFDKYNELINIRVSKYWYNILSNEYEALKISCEFLTLLSMVERGYRPDYEFILEEISLLEIYNNLDKKEFILQYYLNNPWETF
jgi:hypothetical protein